MNVEKRGWTFLNEIIQTTTTTATTSNQLQHLTVYFIQKKKHFNNNFFFRTSSFFIYLICLCFFFFFLETFSFNCYIGIFDKFRLKKENLFFSRVYNILCVIILFIYLTQQFTNHFYCLFIFKCFIEIDLLFIAKVNKKK